MPMKSELLQETDVVLIKQTHIINLIFQKRNTLQTYAECKTSVLFRINSTHAKYIGMNCSTAKDFDPAGSFTETTAFSATFEAGNINLCTWFCKWEVMWSEFCFVSGPKSSFANTSRVPFKVCERNILIYYKAFDLMEGWRMSCIYFIRTEYSSRCDHTDRQFTFFPWHVPEPEMSGNEEVWNY